MRKLVKSGIQITDIIKKFIYGVFNKAVKNIEGSLKRANWDEVDWSEMK